MSGTVLVVEDEWLISTLVATCFSDAGFEALQAKNCYEALEILDNRPDVGLLFTDIEVPGDMDGLELSHLVHRERPDMIIVISSGQRLPTIETLPPGAMFLAKPVQAGQLDLVVEDARRRMAG